jgi:hypothetical protein
MNFWKTLRLIGSLIVLGIAVLTVLLAVLRAPQVNDDAPPVRPIPALKSQSGTTGL